MSFKGPDQVYVKFSDFQIKNQIQNELQRRGSDSLELHDLSVNRQLKNELYRPGSDPYDILWIFNQGSIEEWAPEARISFISNLSIWN